MDCGLQDKEMLDIELTDAYKEKKPVVVVGWKDKGVLYSTRTSGQGGLLTDAASNENEEEDKEDKGVLVRVVQDKDKWTRRSLGTL